MWLELQLTDRLVNLPEEEVDVAVRVGQSPDSRLFSRGLGRATLQLVGAPSRTGMPARVRRFVDLLVARAPDLA